MSKGFAPAAAQKANRPKALEALALSQRLKDCFASIKDPRVERTRLHQLGDILTIAILSVLAGGNGWEDMEVYGRKYSGVVINVFGVAQWHTRVPIPFGEYSSGLIRNNLSTALSNG